MTQMDGSRTPELREDAAMWFALMRGPEAETQRVEFETWLAADPAHRQAYSHISEVFSLGKGLKPAVDVPDARRPARQPMLLARMMGSPFLMLLLLLVSVPMLIGLTVAAMRAIGPGHPLIQADETGRAPVAEASLATSPGEVRAFRLADGSRLILDADSGATCRCCVGGRALSSRMSRGRSSSRPAGALSSRAAPSSMWRFVPRALPSRLSKARSMSASPPWARPQDRPETAER
jgi:transmembrane sensor